MIVDIIEKIETDSANTFLPQDSLIQDSWQNIRYDCAATRKKAFLIYIRK